MTQQFGREVMNTLWKRCNRHHIDLTEQEIENTRQRLTVCEVLSLISSVEESRTNECII